MKSPKLTKIIKAILASLAIVSAISFPLVSNGYSGGSLAQELANYKQWMDGAYAAQEALVGASMNPSALLEIAQNKIKSEAEAKLQQLSNTVSAGVKQTVNSAVNDSLNKITAGAAGKEMTKTGVTVADATNQKGKTNTTAQQKGLTDLAAANNTNEALALQTKLLLDQKVQDRINVSSILDEKPEDATCKSEQGDKCTVMIYLKETEAEATDMLRKRSVAAMLNSMFHGDNWKAQLLRQIYNSQTGASTTQKNDVVSFLTPSNAIPAAVKVTATAMDLKKSQTFTDALIGIRNDSNLKDWPLNANGTDDASQLDAISRIAKVQLARVAISAVHNEYSQQQLSAQYRACAMRPDAKDRIGSTKEQQLVHLQSLMRCTNMSLLQLQQRQMEKQRLQGAVLLTLLDIFAVQAPK